MDLSEIWNQLLFSTTQICLRSLESIQIISPYTSSSESNSSVSTENDDQQEISDNETSPESQDQETDGPENRKTPHRRRYNKEEYRCKQCPYTCTTEGAFFRHLRTNCKSNEPKILSLSCVICGKDRKNEESLARHMFKHRQDKHFCCDICRFKSLQLKKIIQHRRMHTGEKPHLCPFCSYRSSRRDNLRSHVRRVHKRNDLPCDTFTPRRMLVIPTNTNGI